MIKTIFDVVFVRAGLILVLVVACKSIDLPGEMASNDTSEVSVTNGLNIDDSEFPATIEVLRGVGQCTGTFITRNRVLTAAHCVIKNNEASTQIKIVYKGKTYDGIGHLWHKDFDSSAKDTNNNDLAMVYLNEEVDVNPASVCSQVSRGDQVTMVGYGYNNNVKQSGAGERRMGSNWVRSVADGWIRIEGAASNTNTPGLDAATGEGDSGSSLYKGNCIVGVLSGGVLLGGDRSISSFVDLTGTIGQAFLATYNKSPRKMYNATAAYLTITDLDTGVSDRLGAWWNSYGTTLIPFLDGRRYQVRYGNTCITWTPNSNYGNVTVKLLALGASGCGFNWHAGCLDIENDGKGPTEHSTGC